MWLVSQTDCSLIKMNKTDNAHYCSAMDICLAPNCSVWLAYIQKDCSCQRIFNISVEHQLILQNNLNSFHLYYDENLTWSSEMGKYITPFLHNGKSPVIYFPLLVPFCISYVQRTKDTTILHIFLLYLYHIPVPSIPWHKNNHMDLVDRTYSFCSHSFLYSFLRMFCRMYLLHKLFNGERERVAQLY